MLVSDVSPTFLRAFAFVFGALWGSFFNVAIYRWPLGMSVIHPPSHCPACGARVPGYRNLPIVAYLMQRGRAACCGAKMTPRYVYVEVLVAVLAVAVMEAWVVSANPSEHLSPLLIEAGLMFFFVGALVIATFTDFEWTMIPDEVSLGGTAVGLATVAFRSLDPAEIAIGAGVAFLMIQVPFVWMYKAATGHVGMGEGDPKLLMMIGSFLGWKGMLFAFFSGPVQGIVFFLLSRLRKQELVRPEQSASDGPGNWPGTVVLATCNDRGGEVAKLGKTPAPTPPEAAPEPARKMKLPFGPLLALGALEWMFFGEELLQWYLGYLPME